MSGRGSLPRARQTSAAPVTPPARPYLLAGFEGLRYHIGMSKGDDPFAALGVARDAGAEEIDRAYRKAAAPYAPENWPGDPAEAQKRLAEVAAARDTCLGTYRAVPADQKPAGKKPARPEDLARRDLTWLSADAAAAPQPARRTRHRAGSRSAFLSDLALTVIGMAIVVYLIAMTVLLLGSIFGWESDFGFKPLDPPVRLGVGIPGCLLAGTVGLWALSKLWLAVLRRRNR